jgi:hypothetical protein
MDLFAHAPGLPLSGRHQGPSTGSGERAARCWPGHTMDAGFCVEALEIDESFEIRSDHVAEMKK